MFRVTTGCGFESSASQLKKKKNINCLSDETLTLGPVWRCYTPSTLKNQAELSVVSPCILALSTLTTYRLLGESLRWATMFGLWGSHSDGQPVATINKRKQPTHLLYCSSSAFIDDTNLYIEALPLCLVLTTQEAFVDGVDQDQTAQNVQSDL